MDRGDVVAAGTVAFDALDRVLIGNRETRAQSDAPAVVFPRMSEARAHLGDSHNFGRRVTRRDGRIHKPRSVMWEWLLLSSESPLRRRLEGLAAEAGLGPNPFGLLDLDIQVAEAGVGGWVEEVKLEPFQDLSTDARLELARIVGRSIALFSWLGVTDLHWENLVLGVDGRGRLVFSPLDIEMILGDLASPTETKLLPDADEEYAEISRHACGVRRALPYIGKPIHEDLLLPLLASYASTLSLLDKHAAALAAAFNEVPDLGRAPIRVCLRGTGEYIAGAKPWPPFLPAETEQLARGDIPYFFRLYGKPGIHYYGNESLDLIKTLPLKGDVPQLEPLLKLDKGLRAPNRKKLREEGLFAVLGAFDHKALKGTYTSDGLTVTLKGRTLVLSFSDGDELESKRDLSAFVQSVYSPCHCGEVREVFVPETTVCNPSREFPSAR
jgi:hypothetical protein